MHKTINTAHIIILYRKPHTRARAYTDSEHPFPAPSSAETARIGYAMEGVPGISAQLSTDCVHTFRRDRVLIRLWKQHSVQARPSALIVKHTHQFRLDSNDLFYVRPMA